MAANETVMTLASAVGLIVDRTLTPEQVLGEACLVSKGRAVACASAVFNYVESPWALAVKFPHSDLMFGVKTITLHPDFKKREARTHYLTQTGMPTDPPLCLENDLANLSLDVNMAELNPAKIGEINSFLSLQPSVTPQDNTGSVLGPDVASVLQRMTGSGKEGLLTFYDERKRPIARLGVRQGVQGYLQRAIYRSLTGELAVFEMIYRKQRGMFIFQPNTTFNWPNVLDIQTPFDKLLAEASRRDGEMQGFLISLGGADARYVRATQQMDMNAVHPNARWIVERLWAVLDGYLTMDRLWERIGADTYTTMRALQEMLRLQAISLERGSPFSGSGQIGTPLVTIPVQDVTAGEPLVGFYLDPLSGRPVLLQGASQGKGGSSANSMLHNIQFPPNLNGGIVVKNNQLVGLTSGPYVQQDAQPQQAKLYLMTSGMALGDTVKKLRQTSAFDLEAPPPVDASLPKEAVIPEELPTGQIGRFICPNCRSLNLQSGFCKKCGADLETGQMPQPTTDKRTLKEMLEEKGIKKQHLIMGGGALVFLLIMMMNCGGPPPAPPPTATDGQSTTDNAAKGDVKKAIQVATKYAGFKDTPAQGFTFVDSTDLTNGVPAFTLSSEKGNQDILFVVMDNTKVVDNLSLVTVKVPYTNYLPADYMNDVNPDTNKQLLSTGPVKWEGVKFNYVVGRYTNKDDSKLQMVLVGAYKSPEAGKAILVIAKPQKEDILDYQTTLSTIENMAAPLIAKTPDPEAKEAQEAQANKGTGSTEGDKGGTAGEAEKKEATPEELSDYVTKVEETLKSKYTPPKEAAKNTVEVVVGVGEDGSLTKIDITKTSDEDTFNQYVSKLVQSAKFPPAPHTKDGSVQLKVTASGAKLTVAQQ